MIRKVKLGLLLATLSLSLTVQLVSTSTVNAAIWHSGTPKILRGNWYRTNHAGTGSNRFAYKTGTIIGKSKFDGYGLGDPFAMNHLKYKKVSKHAYIFSGIEYMYSHKVNHVKIVKSGHKIRYRITYPAIYKSSYSQWFTKH